MEKILSKFPYSTPPFVPLHNIKSEPAQAAATTTNAPTDQPAATNATTAPAKNATAQSAATPPATQVQAARQAVSAYGDVTPYIDRLHAAQRDPGAYLEQIDEINRLLPQSIEEYKRTGRNPLADIVLERQKPRRNVDEEKRLKTQAVLQSFNNLFSLLGKGIAASAGLRPTPVNNKPIEDIQHRLQQLDDIYRNEEQRYNQNELLAAMRKDQTNLQAAKEEVDALSARRKGYIDMYKDELEHNRQLEEKAAELGVKSSQFRTDLQYKYDNLNETKRHNRTNESLQSRRIEKEHPDTLLRDTVNGGYIELTPEVRADLAGVVSRIMEQRESAKKGPYGEWMAGKYPLPMNNELTDEELTELKDALKDGKVSIKQEAILTRLLNSANGGGFYDPEVEHPYGVAPKPTSGYAESIHDQYKNYLAGELRHMLDSEQMENNTITIEHAKELFDGLKMAPANAVKRVLLEAGFRVID